MGQPTNEIVAKELRRALRRKLTVKQEIDGHESEIATLERERRELSEAISDYRDTLKDQDAFDPETGEPIKEEAG